MSKGNMLLGFARGKVGDLVFSRSNGQQVVRAKATHIKNPQTRAQMIQRILMATVSQAYSKMQPIVDHSFEGVQPGQKTMSMFTTKNIKALRARVAAAVANGVNLNTIFAFTPVGASTYAPNAFIIAEGSLPSIQASITDQEGAYYVGNFPVRTTAEHITYQDVLNVYGLQRGDQLTFVEVESTMGEGSGSTFHYARVILDPRNEDGSEAALTEQFIVSGAINKPSPRNEGSFTVIAEFEDPSVPANKSVQFILGGFNTTLGCAVIVSRKNSDGSWLRSKTQLAINDTALLSTADYYSIGECLDMLDEDAIGGLNSRYLNNAGRGRLPETSAVNAIQVTFAYSGNHNWLESEEGWNPATEDVEIYYQLTSAPSQPAYQFIAVANGGKNVGDVVAASAVASASGNLDAAGSALLNDIQQSGRFGVYLASVEDSNYTVEQLVGNIDYSDRP